tara:strand:- start:6745 stop:7287 length:543 start_codon:yes stop_codon:yes gene_type:complete
MKKYYLIYNKMENSEESIVKYNYHFHEENSEDGEDEKTTGSDSGSGSTCSSVGLVESVCDLSIKEPEKYPGSSSDDDIPSLDTTEEKKLTLNQKRRVKTGKEINQMYQILIKTGLSWDQIKEIVARDKDQVEKIRNDFNELFKDVSDIDPIKHETKALLILMGILEMPLATHPDLDEGVY